MFILIYMSFHLGSLYLGLCSVINIAMSLPISLLIYTYVLNVTYIGSEHISSALIIIGIGADDIFVFHGFWLTTFKIKVFKD